MWVAGWALLTKRRGLGSICRASRLSSRPSRCQAKCTQGGRVGHWGGGSTLSPCSTRAGAQQRALPVWIHLGETQKQGQPVATWILACKDRRARVDHLGLGAVTPAMRPCAVSQDPEVLSPYPGAQAPISRDPRPHLGTTVVLPLWPTHWCSGAWVGSLFHRLGPVSARDAYPGMDNLSVAAGHAHVGTSVRWRTSA